MKECRLSEFNQVIEVFEKGFYDGCDNQKLINEIMECPENIEPLMWCIKGQFIPHEDYALVRHQPLTYSQIEDTLMYLLGV